MRVVISVFLCAISLPSVAAANDGAFGGSGASLAPLESTPIRMVREDIVMELRGQPLAWNVTAVYEFENPTNGEVALQMGYPETRCDDGEGECVGQGGRFRSLRTLVRGRAVRHRVGSVTADSPWAMDLSRVHLFDVRFAAHERVRVEHRYTYDRSFTAVLGENVFYLTRTGALWNGPIGEARFTVRTPNPPLLVEHPTVFRLVSWNRLVARGRGVTELVFEARRWTPAVDFGLLLGDQARVELGGEAIGDGSVDVTECPPGISGGRDTPERRRVVSEWIRDSTREELVACRNYVFALSGYTFRHARWARAFYGGPRREAAMGEAFTVATLRPAAAFTQAQMPAHHGAYVRRIQAELARLPPDGSGSTEAGYFE